MHTHLTFSNVAGMGKWKLKMGPRSLFRLAFPPAFSAPVAPNLRDNYDEKPGERLHKRGGPGRRNPKIPTESEEMRAINCQDQQLTWLIFAGSAFVKSVTEVTCGRLPSAWKNLSLQHYKTVKNLAREISEMPWPQVKWDSSKENRRNCGKIY